MPELNIISAPSTEQELIARVRSITGKTIEQLARVYGLTVPSDQGGHKGWVGELVERCLGATACSRAEPDFQLIGVELKTIPINRHGNPKESTYVCTVTLSETTGLQWETSVVRKKLARVLWLPIESDSTIPLAKRRLGNGFLWSPDKEQEDILRSDWEEIMELVSTGELDRVSSAMGQYLQVRPKAANAASRGISFSSEGIQTTTLPRGFYLRSSFTRAILASCR